MPTSEDLAGFWDMVYIQVEHIHSLFAELSTLRQNGWKRPEVIFFSFSIAYFFISSFLSFDMVVDQNTKKFHILTTIIKIKSI